MKNTKETLQKIRYHKKQADILKSEIKRLSGELAFHNRKAKELDEVRLHWSKVSRFKKRVEILSKKQDLIVNALRLLKVPSTAGPICDELKKVGIECRSDQFISRYGEAVRQDQRVFINSINASKNEYSLVEWDSNQD